MTRIFNRRSVSIVGVLLGTQLLSACIILPRPYLPRPYLPHERAVIIVPAPGHHHGRGQDGERYERRDWDRR
jgi:hypothetical protein